MFDRKGRLEATRKSRSGLQSKSPPRLQKRRIMRRLIARAKTISRRQLLVATATIVALVVVAWTIKTFRHYVLPHHFYVVENGGIYRGARQTSPILRKLIREYGIRTIVNLDDKVLEREDRDRPGADRYADEKAIVKEYGLQYYGFCWQGSGVGPYPEYDAAADILATTSSRPIFLHCAAGEKRTNAALAAYWIRHRGYTLQQAIDGLLAYGLSPVRKQDFLAHLRGYYEYVRANPRPKLSPVASPKQP